MFTCNHLRQAVTFVNGSQWFRMDQNGDGSIAGPSLTALAAPNTTVPVSTAQWTGTVAYGSTYDPASPSPSKQFMYRSTYPFSNTWEISAIVTVPTYLDGSFNQLSNQYTYASPRGDVLMFDANSPSSNEAWLWPASFAAGTAPISITVPVGSQPAGHGGRYIYWNGSAFVALYQDEYFYTISLTGVVSSFGPGPAPGIRPVQVDKRNNTNEFDIDLRTSHPVVKSMSFYGSTSPQFKILQHDGTVVFWSSLNSTRWPADCSPLNVFFYQGYWYVAVRSGTAGSYTYKYLKCKKDIWMPDQLSLTDWIELSTLTGPTYSYLQPIEG